MVCRCALYIRTTLLTSCWHPCNPKSNTVLFCTSFRPIKHRRVGYKIFFLNETILLQINKLSSASRYSLSWYHNGTQVMFNERMTVSGNGTSLLIVNMTESDAGKYEVKLSSINSCGCSSSPTCDRNIMNMFEFSAMFSPVTFYLHQHQIPQYKPENVIKVYFLRVKHPTINTTYSITTNYTHSINISYIFGRNSVFYQHMLRNGVSQSLNESNVQTERSTDSSNIFISHEISSRNTEDVVGHYVYLESARCDYINRNNCREYSDCCIVKYFPVLVKYWIIQIGEKIYHVVMKLSM